MECQNCGNNFEENYCNICGQKIIKNRYTLKDVLVNATDLFFNLERGLIFTVKELSLRPGILITEYIAGKRVKYYNPFKFLVIFIAVGTFFSLKIEELGAKSRIIKITESSTDTIFIFFTNYWDILSLLLVPIFSIFSFLLFKRSGYNFTENLILNSYVVGYHSLISTIFYLIFWIFNPEWGSGLYPMILGFAFSTICYIQFFKVNLIEGIIKSFLVTVFGYSLFMILLLLSILF